MTAARFRRRNSFHRNGSDRGSVTVEAALVLTVLVVVVVSCLAGIGCVVSQMRCADAAREAARLAGRGDSAGAEAAVKAIGPGGAALSVDIGPQMVTATVSVGAVGGALPGVTIRASATAANEAAAEHA